MLRMPLSNATIMDLDTEQIKKEQEVAIIKDTKSV